jgi:hypothetical protein
MTLIGRIMNNFNPTRNQNRKKRNGDNINQYCGKQWDIDRIRMTWGLTSKSPYFMIKELQIKLFWLNNLKRRDC